MRFLSLWFAIVAAGGLWFLWSAGEADGPAAMWLSILLAGALGGFALPNVVTRRNLIRSLAQGREANITIAPHGIGSEIAGLTANEWTWTAIQSVVLTPDGLMLYVGKGAFIWAPEHGFFPLEGMESAFEMAQRSGARTRRVT